MINDILVVDDDPIIVEFVISILHEASYLCCAAYDGESALLAIEIARPALVLLDLHLPELTGLDVVQQLHRHGLADVPVVLITADDTATALANMYQCGCSCALRFHPSNPDDMVGGFDLAAGDGVLLSKALDTWIVGRGQRQP